MGEALISGAGGGTGKIYRWKRYEINSKTIYTWDKYNANSELRYYWNKWNAETSTSWSESMVDDMHYMTWGTGTFKILGSKAYRSWTTNSSGYVGEDPVVNAGGYHLYIKDCINSDLPANALIDTNRWYFKSTWYDSSDGEDKYSYTQYRIIQITTTKKGTTSYGQVSSTSSSAYPSNGASGSYWYVSAGSGTAYLKGSTSYGQVESESSSAYPNGGPQGGYWYENRNSRIEQSIGSYKDQVYSTARNTYPDNGIQGGYWYVFEEV